MLNIRKQIITDKSNRPVAVRIEYDDWCRIEEALKGNGAEKPPTDLSRHIGKLNWPVDGLAFQHQIRSAWN